MPRGPIWKLCAAAGMRVVGTRRDVTSDAELPAGGRGAELDPVVRLLELDAVGEAEASKRELTMAQQLIDSLSAEFDPDKFRDDYRDRVLDLIERKAAGEEIAVQPEAEDTTPAPDLMAALEASLAEIRSGDSDEPAKKPAAKPRKSAAKSRSAGSSGNGSGKSGSGGASGQSKAASTSKSGSASKSRAKAKS